MIVMPSGCDDAMNLKLAGAQVFFPNAVLGRAMARMGMG